MTRITAGGYVFVRAFSRPDTAETELLPAELWTPTSCLCDLYPEHWAFSWCKPRREAVRSAVAGLGLEPSDLEALQAWADTQLEAGGMGFPGMLLHLDAAREFEARFLRAGPEIKLLGIGLPESDAQAFLTEAEPGPGEGAPGVYQAIAAGAPLAGGGTSLGFEPLGYEFGAFHSFVCNALQNDYAKELGLRLNDHGRFSDLAESERAVAYTRLDSTGAEPALWQSWAVVEYPRETG